MRRALPYRPRFNAPPHPEPRPCPKAAGRPRTTISTGVLVFLGAVVLFAILARSVPAQEKGRDARSHFDSALAVATADSAWSRVAQSYYDSTFRGNDWSAVRRELRGRAERSKSMPEVRTAIEAMFARLGESHFVLVPYERTTGDAEAPEEGEVVGDVGLEFRRLDGAIVVSRVLAGSPAERAGVRTGWSLERLGDLDVDDFSRTRLHARSQSARRLAELQLPLALMGRAQGHVGSLLPIVLRDSAGTMRRVMLRRAAIDGEVVRMGHLPPLVVRVESERRDDAQGCVGVLRFNIWMTPIMPHVDEAMVAFRGCRGVVLDLRGNVGGVAAMVMGLGGYFLDSVSSLGTMTTRRGVMRYMSNPRRSDRQGRVLAPFAGPVAILVDGLSVSTSEIFAAGLQALGRARVFGDPTAGQALPSMVAQLPNGDVMQYVVADFAAPDGRRIEARGVIPDVCIPLRRQALLEGRDEVLDAAVRWIGR
jgi:carboxyl-terminal processing protease